MNAVARSQQFSPPCALKRPAINYRTLSFAGLSRRDAHRHTQVLHVPTGPRLIERRASAPLRALARAVCGQSSGSEGQSHYRPPLFKRAALFKGVKSYLLSQVIKDCRKSVGRHYTREAIPAVTLKLRPRVQGEIRSCPLE